MDLKDYRAQIDAIDDKLVRLFQQRMEAAASIAAYKKAHALPILQPSREREKLEQLGGKTQPELQAYVRVLYSLLFELSRCYQARGSQNALYERLCDALAHTPDRLPSDACVAAVEGASAALCCARLFSAPKLHTFCTVSDVFSAIESGVCRYGIVPTEDGADACVYALLCAHRCCIVRSVQIGGDCPSRYLCICKQPELYPDADRTCLMLVLSHQTAALFQVLARLYTLGIGLLRLESHPLPDREDAMLLCLELQLSACSEGFAPLLCDLGGICEEYHFLGSYSEVV